MSNKSNVWISGVRYSDGCCIIKQKIVFLEWNYKLVGNVKKNSGLGQDFKTPYPKTGVTWITGLAFIQISNCWASEIQIILEIWNIGKPNSFRLFKIRAHLDFRSPLYYVSINFCCHWNMIKKVTNRYGTPDLQRLWTGPNTESMQPDPIPNSSMLVLPRIKPPAFLKIQTEH